MNPLVLVAAALAGGVGAVLRYVVDLAVMRVAGRRFPWGIVLVNITGSFALGLVTTALPEVLFVVGAGLLGGYTTFSTASVESVRLIQERRYGSALLSSVGMLVLTIVASAGGLLLGSAA